MLSFSEWLKFTKNRQKTIYGILPADDAEICEEIAINLLAAVAEIGEVLREFQWKPWQKREPYVNRDRLLGEVVDLLHFTANILVAAGINDDVLLEAYKKKSAANLLRQQIGYDGSKCMEPVTDGLCRLEKDHGGDHL